MTRRKFFLFAAAAALLSVVVMLAGLLALDLYIHHRASRSAGLNRWGYRGPVVGRKQPGELRVAMLGGSTAFGYGVRWNEAIPAALERELNQAPPAGVRVVNLGYNNEGAFSFVFTLQDFAYLDYDVVILYEGYNDLSGDNIPNRAVFRHESPVFRLTGYFPMLPLALGEKALAIRSGGNLEAAYAASRGEATGQTVFRPGLVDRSSATALEATAKVVDTLGRQLDRLSKEKPPPPPAANRAGCASPWVHYCDSVDAAVRLALDAETVVVVVSQPALHGEGSGRHTEQRAALAAMMVRRYAGNPRVRHADLTDLVDLRDTELSFDGMHLGADGNLIVAKALVDPVMSVATALRSRTP